MHNYNRNSHVHNALQKIMWRKMWRKPIKAVQNLFDIKKYLALVLKKNVHVILCVFQTNLNKVVNIFCIG